MSAVWDRDAAREVLLPMRFDEYLSDDELMDALEACVRAAPPQDIDRDALQAAIEEYDDGAWSQSDENLLKFDGTIDLDHVLALLRPVKGLVIACARCGRRILAETDNTAENDAMEVCSRCMHAIDMARPGAFLTPDEAALAAIALRARVFTKMTDRERLLAERLEGSL